MFVVHCASQIAHAAPTADDVFKSMQQQTSSHDDSMDGRKVLGFLAAIGGVIVLVVAINRVQQKRVEAPKTLNHQGKLVRELMKSAGLKSAQIRQLKALRDDLDERGQPVENLITLLLCPSLIRKARDPNPEKSQL
jgi:hypothetical protein